MHAGAGTTPTPVVVMNTPSPLPCSTTLVSPVTTGTPALAPPRPSIDDALQLGEREAFFEDEARRSGQSGAAPIIATSLSVPCTARQPMSPPGKNSGETTWPSVAITRRCRRAAGSSAPSSPWRRYSLSKAGANSSSISCAEARPPGAVVHVDAAAA